MEVASCCSSLGLGTSSMSLIACVVCFVCLFYQQKFFCLSKMSLGQYDCILLLFYLSVLSL